MEKIFIIAEAGDNHNGSLMLARQLVDKAAEAGADCVKFQTFVTEELVSKRAKKAQYQEEATGTGESQYEMIKKLELSFDKFVELQRYTKEKGLIFLSKPFDIQSEVFFERFKIQYFKKP